MRGTNISAAKDLTGLEFPESIKSWPAAQMCLNGLNIPGPRNPLETVNVADTSRLASKIC